MSVYGEKLSEQSHSCNWSSTVAPLWDTVDVAYEKHSGEVEDRNCFIRKYLGTKPLILWLY